MRGWTNALRTELSRSYALAEQRASMTAQLMIKVPGLMEQAVHVAGGYLEMNDFDMGDLSHGRAQFDDEAVGWEIRWRGPGPIRSLVIGVLPREGELLISWHQGEGAYFDVLADPGKVTMAITDALVDLARDEHWDRKVDIDQYLSRTRPRLWGD